MIKRVISATICGCFFAAGASATWATITAAPQLLAAHIGAIAAKSKAIVNHRRE